MAKPLTKPCHLMCIIRAGNGLTLHGMQAADQARQRDAQQGFQIQELQGQAVVQATQLQTLEQQLAVKVDQLGNAEKVLVQRPSSPAQLSEVHISHLHLVCRAAVIEHLVPVWLTF